VQITGLNALLPDLPDRVLLRLPPSAGKLYDLIYDDLPYREELPPLRRGYREPAASRTRQ
jgi:hypothetical protein